MAKLAEKNMLQKTVEQLNKEITLLKAELEKLKNRHAHNIQNRQNDQTNEYFTDEEEFN